MMESILVSTLLVQPSRHLHPNHNRSLPTVSKGKVDISLDSAWLGLTRLGGEDHISAKYLL